ncbi:DNA polymerase/3'-5' exonuclease PolX [Paraburkholderia sp. UYCP14C]|uniref:DNA polymerase/3'-5' exonuclease PolX n=1 Tax=Paraburkholderia sp. UYCP14C TaxID=2511130 RepID=UPI0010214778|nr:DNA polymerase/3'-5' exonuclease PolX [Paraburkholderia sp. UYCP14C]RZF24520.1 DNA polymerase/3'-5' exonuclease PolX [Paraburkholderia sp. UYCP14C]
MPLHNADFVAAFEEIADLLELQGETNPFRIRAYRRAARNMSGLGRDLATMIARNEDLHAVGGIGADLAAKLREIAATGTCALLDELRHKVPAGLPEMLTLPGVGPGRARMLHETLHIDSLDALREAASAGKLHAVPGFGERLESRILEAIDARRSKSHRFLLTDARQNLEPLLGWLNAIPETVEAVCAGSYRRRRETVGDLDILVTSSNAAAVMRRFVLYDDIETVLARGTTRASVVLRGGLQVDLRVVAPERLGAALVYFTGSRAHNIAIRRIAQAQGMKLNEYGVYRGERRVAGATEESVYRSIGLAWVPPELREDRGEVEAARTGRLPELVKLGDLRGDLHAHTNASDGRDSLRDMALGARARGLRYLAITDHSRRLGIAHGLDAQRLARQIDEIDRLNAELDRIVLLKGVEVDILEDGRLDLPDDLLSRLDIVVASVHSHFGLARAKQTARILRVLDHPYVSILGHPTGRLLLEREPMALDLERIIARAAERGCCLELNSQPQRLDLDDVACRAAKQAGVLVSIASDAHSRGALGNLEWGVAQARRAGLSKVDVLNTRPIAQLWPLLRKRIADDQDAGTIDS